MTTTGNFTTAQIKADEDACVLPQFNLEIASKLGLFATELAQSKKLSVAISIFEGEWEVFKVCLPGTKPLNSNWIRRKARTVYLTRTSTMFQRVNAEEQNLDWHELHSLSPEDHAIHGGGFPIATPEGFCGALVIGGLPQVDDHLFAIEILAKFKESLS